MKLTCWTELINYKIIAYKRNAYTNYIVNIRIESSELPGRRWFTEAKSGNWYSRYTSKNSSQCEGFIIKETVEINYSQFSLLETIGDIQIFNRTSVE